MIQQIAKWCALVFLCIIAQTSLIPSLSIGSIQPDLILMSLFFLAIRFGMTAGIYTGFFLGLGLDLYAPGILGQFALSKTVTGFFAGIFNERIMKTEPVIKAVLLFVAFIIHDLIFTGVELVQNGQSLVHLLPNLLSHTVPRALYSLALILLLFIWNQMIRPNLKR